MSEGFTTYTAATADADSIGKGMDEARAALVELIISDQDDPNFVQEVSPVLPGGTLRRTF